MGEPELQGICWFAGWGFYGSGGDDWIAQTSRAMTDGVGGEGKEKVSWARAVQLRAGP